MKKTVILICLVLLLSGCNGQTAEVIDEPINDSFEAVVETECGVERPSIDDRIESVATTLPTESQKESYVEVANDIPTESVGTPVVDTSSYVLEETASVVVEEIKEEPIQAETAVEEQISTPSPVTSEPETAPAQTTEPEVQKSVYDYEFDIEAIRQELLAVGTGMGLTIDTSLTPHNSSWANPVIATEGYQGAGLERALKDYVRSMPDIIVAYGGEPIQCFNIYTESVGSGSYQIYFLY